jgi:thymidylate kinase
MLVELRSAPVPACGDSPAVLGLIQAALRSLQSAGVRFCTWKSARRLAAVLAGDGDLDLLIARADQHSARQALAACGFKAFADATGRAHPAVESFLGYDEASGRIVHVHAHFRLVLGARLLKNYQPPLEDALLAHAVPHPVLPLAMLDPLSEVVLLVARACVELRRDDPVTLRHWAATRAKFESDRAALRPTIAPAALRARTAALLGEAVAGTVVAAFFGDRDLAHRPVLRHRVRRALAPYRSFNTGEALLRGAWRSLVWAAGGINRDHLRWPRPWGRRAPGGGIVVAALGVDGSGKSTVTRELRRWLGSEVDVLPMYFGTGDGRPSLLLLPFKLLVPLISRMLPARPAGASHGNVATAAPGPLYSALLMVWATVLAAEKRRKLLAARRAASRGMVVIADRYPQNQLAGFNDGPLLPRLPWAPRWMRRFEAGAYALAGQLPPDLVLKLATPAETLARREPTMDRGLIRERVRHLRLLAFPGARVVTVDASQPLEDVIRAAKAEVWRLL